MTRAQIIERLQASGNPSIFEEACLQYIRELEATLRGLASERDHYKAMYVTFCLDTGEEVKP
jgi:hypothetical protein